MSKAAARFCSEMAGVQSASGRNEAHTPRLVSSVTMMPARCHPGNVCHPDAQSFPSHSRPSRTLSRHVPDTFSFHGHCVTPFCHSGISWLVISLPQSYLPATLSFRFPGAGISHIFCHFLLSSAFRSLRHFQATLSVHWQFVSFLTFCYFAPVLSSPCHYIDVKISPLPSHLIISLALCHFLSSV